MTDDPKLSPTQILVLDVRGHIERLENARVALRMLLEAMCTRDAKFPHQGFDFVIDEMSGPLDALEHLVEGYADRHGRAA